MSDEEWAFFRPFLAEPGAAGGRPAADHRRVLDAIFWIARTGAPWRDLPTELGRWNSVHRQFRRWTVSGIWDVMLEALVDSGGPADALQMIDSTIVRAHHCAAGFKKGTQSQALGRSRGGLSTRIHLRANAEGLPIGIILSPGEAHDSTAYADLMDERDSDPGILLADRGYDSDAIRQDARDRGTIPEIPTKRNRRIQHSVDRPLYALRNRIERCFNKLKNSRRIATRYDQTASSFLGFTLLASIRLWFRFVHAS
ncbi:IS5 family transposase [Acidiphilium sp. JA12-A1]|uniref:IS5 family transposase n=1 Tax=Acidiphilium sp. JA12-A1 TaxID=1464546 RepID=UPI001F07DAE9|nr:IS5 family transposase [Acidiphilium sp. JA12-A1]